MKKSLRENLVKLMVGGAEYAVFADCSAIENETEFLNLLAGWLIEKSSIVHLSTSFVSARNCINVGRKVKTLCAQLDTAFVVESRADIALELEADGVFLKNDDVSISLVKEILGDNILLGTDSLKDVSLFDYVCMEKIPAIGLTTPIFCYEKNILPAIKVFKKV